MLSKNTIEFHHEKLPCWCGEIKYKSEFHMKQALRNLSLLVPHHVKRDLRVKYRGEDKRIYSYTIV